MCIFGIIWQVNRICVGSEHSALFYDINDLMKDKYIWNKIDKYHFVVVNLTSFTLNGQKISYNLQCLLNKNIGQSFLFVVCLLRVLLMQYILKYSNNNILISYKGIGHAIYYLWNGNQSRSLQDQL